MQIDFRLLTRVYLIEIAYNMYTNCKYKFKNLIFYNNAWGPSLMTHLKR